jgi:hypothetical protein
MLPNDGCFEFELSFDSVKDSDGAFEGQLAALNVFGDERFHHLLIELGLVEY